MKVSYKDDKEIEKFIKWIKDNYEDQDIGKVKISHGKVHNYLGIRLDFSSPREVKIDMIDYIEKMVEDFPEKTTTVVSTPAATHLFEVRDDVKKLDDERAEQFHNLVARGLFVCKRARLDIQTAIAFLTTRVSQPDTDDWKKLSRLINYLHGTKNFVLTLTPGEVNVLKWYVDAAYAVHKDMRSHTSGVLIMGAGTPIATSIKQKMNTRSSTEAELVGVDDVMGHILWTNYFLEAQGYESLDTVLYQDNKSAILLEKNGKLSSGKRTKHINIRYFFITDRVNKNELRIEHCPTDDMVADFFSKPLQGTKFTNFRKKILNLKNN